MILTQQKPTERFDQNARRSRMVTHADTIHFADQCGDDLTGGVAQQTCEGLAQFDERLAKVSSVSSRLLDVPIWFADMDNCDVKKVVYGAWVTLGRTPCRACGEVNLRHRAY